MDNRREFFKKVGLGTGMLFAGMNVAALAPLYEKVENDYMASKERSKSRKVFFNMHDYAAPPLPIVKIGFIGIGVRGGSAVSRIVNIKGVEINALCDTREYAVKINRNRLKAAGMKPAAEYYGDEYAWKKLCERDDINLVYIATPWKWHVEMALYAMECGKHVAVEVPAATTLEGCWQLVEMSEKTKLHCMQLENCCYDFFETFTIQMAQKGLLGELVHAEGAYIHDQMDAMFGGRPVAPAFKEAFRPFEHMGRSGNLYPTHGLGPVALALNINRGDRMDYMSSVSSSDFSMLARARQLAETDDYYDKFTRTTYRGNMNSSIIKTVNGKTILLQHDVSSPRPYSRIHLLSGTKGFVQKYPLPAKVAFGHQFMENDKLKELEEQYSPQLIKHISEMAKKIGGHGGMDFVMDWRLVDCLRNGLPLDMDVYDAAAWSAIIPLSVWSVANRSQSMDIPDFTGGLWKDNGPVDFSLRGGGNTDVKSK